MLPSATVFEWLYNAGRWTWHDPDGYNFISGPLADITLLGGAYALLRHHNCHIKHCWRIGRHPVQGTGYIVCRRHHPHPSPTVEQVHKEHLAYMHAMHLEPSKHSDTAPASEGTTGTPPHGSASSSTPLDQPPPHRPPG
jgi:hypothetical protein